MDGFGIFPDSWFREALGAMPLTVVPFDEDLAYRAGLLRRVTRAAGLSLGDRACIALAQRTGAPVLTADRAWAALSLPVDMHIVR